MHTTSKSPVKRQTTAANNKSVFSKIFVLCFFVLLSVCANSQTDNCNLRVSLLTCGPGEELYSVFGHSAIRVSDSARGTDIIFNYGTFDFDDPDFYKKFVLGKLLYYVSVERFDLFMKAYKYENRYIIEQQLQLTCSEKQKLFDALQNNSREENKFYKYEFLFDNCSTRLRDMVAKNTEDSLTFKQIIPQPAPTFRNMLHEYLFKGEKYWSAFGIDLLLASRIDRKVKNEESMFLPDYLMKGFDSATIVNRPLVQSKSLILPNEENTSSGFSITPMMVMIIFLLAGILLYFRKQWERAASAFDGFLFFALGIMGSLMLFMWFGTEHELCRNNYNLYWALPTHLVAAFFVNRNTSLVRKYFSLSAILCTVFILCWPFLPQGMNSAFFPLVLLSAIRSFYRATKK